MALAAVLAGCGMLAMSASAAGETLTLRTKGGVLGSSAHIDGGGTFSVVAPGKHTITCSDSALEGLALLANEASVDRDELFYQGWTTRGSGVEGRCLSSWSQGSSVEVEFDTKYYEVLFEATGHGAIIGSCEEGCNKLNLRLHFTNEDACAYEFLSAPLKFKPGAAGRPKPVKATLSDKVTPTSVFPPTCPASFTLKAKYTFAVGGETLESESV